MKKKSFLPKTIALMAALTIPSIAEIAITDTFTIVNRENNLNFNFPADSADKLVLVICGEHGFNNAAGALNSVTYDGVALTEATYRSAQTGGTDTLYHGIWYLDNPATSTGDIAIVATTRATVSAFLLTGTAPGHGASGFSGTDTRSIDLTTTATESMVMAAFAVGGSGNTGDTRSIDPDQPLTEVSSIRDGSNWQGHVVGTTIVDNPSEGTYSFTGGDEIGGFVAAAEFLSADGVVGGSNLVIGDVQFSAESDEVTLTWVNTSAASYVAKLSTDLIAFDTTVLGGITAASDTNPDDADNITVTLPLPAGFEGSSKLFFRVEEETAGP